MIWGKGRIQRIAMYHKFRLASLREWQGLMNENAAARKISGSDSVCVLRRLEIWGKVVGNAGLIRYMKMREFQACCR